MPDSLESLSERSVEDLLIMLADEQFYGMADLDPKQKAEMGRVSLLSWFRKMRDDLCAEGIGGSKPSDTETIARDAGAILDLALALAGQPPAALISVLIVKYGRDRLCAET